MTTTVNNIQITSKLGLFEKLFSVFMALYPLLCIYKGFSSFTIGDLLLIAFFLVALTKQKTITIESRLVLISFFVLYAFFALAINLLFTNAGETYGTTALLLRLIKFAFYMASALICGKNFLDPRLFKNTIYICSIAACAFLVLQYIAFFGAGKIILGQIPGLSLHLDEYTLLDYETLFESNFRPSSFFLEPALFTHFIIVALVFALFDKHTHSKGTRIVLIVVFSLGIILSTAAQGIIYLIVAFLGYALKGIKNKIRAFAFLIFFACVALILVNNVEVLQTALDRLFNNEGAAEARLGTYRYCFEMDSFASLFGNGYGATANGEYMAGVAYVWYGSGLTGLAIVFCIFAALYKKADNNTSKVLCIIFLVMFFGTGLFYNYMVYWYFSLIMVKYTISGGGNTSICTTPNSI